jgi:hypothetical protein
VDGEEILTNIVEDTSFLEGRLLIEGRYPKHNNEEYQDKRK